MGARLFLWEKTMLEKSESRGQVYDPRSEPEPKAQTVPLSEEDIRKIVRDELSNFSRRPHFA